MGCLFIKKISCFRLSGQVEEAVPAAYFQMACRLRKMARSSLASCVRLGIAAVIGFCSVGTASAQTTSNSGFGGADDTINRLDASQSARERDNLVESDRLKQLYTEFDARRARLYQSTGLKLGAFHSTLLQGANRSLPGQDNTGIATISALYGTWDLVERGNASAGQLSFGVEARWGYGDNLTPSELGFIGIGSATGTSDPYGETDPVVILRELFWRGGSPERGLDYRIGKITPDRLLTGTEFGDPVSMFLPIGSQGSPSVGFPDSGLGFAVGVYPTDYFRFGVVVADANGDRANFGDISEGNFFKAIEFQAKLFPLTQTTGFEKAGFSSVTLWHTDGTDDPANALDSSTGAAGWGFFVKLEQELSTDGKNIGMIRYGHSYDGAAVYKEQGSIRYIRLDPPDPFGLRDDRFGIAASFVKPLFNPFDRDEWGVDAFYRFNPFERAEATFGYQVIVDPAYNPTEDNVSIFSYRFTQFF